MSQLVKMARELLTIDEDIPYRFAHNREKVTVNDFELYTFEQVRGYFAWCLSVPITKGYVTKRCS